jgi:predicted DCC family thiol-disulfide oxidoreductase YuxK
MNNYPTVFFDGICNLCNGAVLFIIKRDKKNRFRFASLQGEAGQAFLQQHQLPADTFNSFILAEENKIYTRSTAALRVCKYLNGGWPLMYGFIIIPRFISDAVYNLIARNRYKWFGKKEACWIPTPALKEKFLD